MYKQIILEAKENKKNNESIAVLTVQNFNYFQLISNNTLFAFLVSHQMNLKSIEGKDQITTSKITLPKLI